MENRSFFFTCDILPLYFVKNSTLDPPKDPSGVSVLISTPIRTAGSVRREKEADEERTRDLEAKECRVALSFRAIVFLTKQKCKKANGRGKKDNRTVSERHQRVDAIVTVGGPSQNWLAKLGRVLTL